MMNSHIRDGVVAKSTFHVVLLLLALLSGKGMCGETRSPGAVFDVGDRAQLFIDKLIVRQSDNVAFTLHPGKKHPSNPLVVADQPWEGWRVEMYGNVLFDEQENCFKMWYLCAGAGKFAEQFATCFARSADGIHWEKPLVGTVDDGSGKPNNIVSPHHLASVYKDVSDPDPSRRYKMTCSRLDERYPSYSYWRMVSPDGFTWNLEGNEPFAPGFDVVNTHWDPHRKLFVAFNKTHGLMWRGFPRRCFDVTSSPDFKTWSAPVPAFRPDLADDASSLARLEATRGALDRPDDARLMRTEFYGVGAYPHESCTIAFPWIFTINNRARWGNDEGPMEVQLAVSRDLAQWERPFREPIIPMGPLSEWDSGGQVTASSAIRVGDEIRLYYGGSNCTHGTPAVYRVYFEDGSSTGRQTRFNGSIGLVTWPLDRFVSVDGSSQGGTLTTIPFTFDGGRLEINARTKGKGSVVVELLDAAGKPLDGFAASEPIQGDDLRHTVRWQAKTDVSAWAQKPVSLRFRLQDAELYSFAFRK
ncbi:MAG TPA: hypothetical protein VHD36_24785 [Pirellulales bacterium]|nr:hypothetical protein [Pirellulales bacterium]